MFLREGLVVVPKSKEVNYLEERGVYEAGVVVDELEEEHLERVAVLVLRLSPRVFPGSYFPGNELEHPTTWTQKKKKNTVMMLMFPLFHLNCYDIIKALTKEARLKRLQSIPDADKQRMVINSKTSIWVHSFLILQLTYCPLGSFVP